MYLKSPAEMAEVFRSQPEALKNTLRVAEMCSELKLKLGQATLPNFPVPDGLDTVEYFRRVSQQGLEARFAQFDRVSIRYDRVEYQKRLDLEVNVIAGMDYPGYFLIVWDFVREAKARGIP